MFGLSASLAFGQATPADSAKGPYKVLKTAKVGGEGGFDYVTADADTRHLFVVRSGQGGRISCYDLDTVETGRRNPQRQRRPWRGRRSQDRPRRFPAAARW